jgi:hypothetical protein
LKKLSSKKLGFETISSASPAPAIASSMRFNPFADCATVLTSSVANLASLNAPPPRAKGSKIS